MKNYQNMKKLGELLIKELRPIKGISGTKRFLVMNGYDAETLADMGFSETFLSDMGMTVDMTKLAAPQEDVSAIHIRDRVLGLIPSLRDSRTHSSAMDEISGLMGDLNEFCFCGNLELTFNAMRGIFETYIAENGIADKAETEGCHTMEYLGLSESEAYSIMGEDAA